MSAVFNSFSLPDTDIVFPYDLLTGAFWSLPLERFQAPREKESFVINSTFVPIPNFQTQEVDAIQLRLPYATVSLELYSHLFLL